MKINRIQVMIGLAIVSAIILTSFQNPFTGKDRDNQEIKYIETEINFPDPLKLGTFLGETSENGQLNFTKFLVTKHSPGVTLYA